MPHYPLLLINGPNLNLLGRRAPEHYGRFTLDDAETLARQTAAASGYDLICFQSNHEGALIDQIQQTLGTVAGIAINAGALTHYSYALRDALELCDCPVIELHISNISQREPFRRHSVIRDVCSEQISGHGLDSYRLAIESLCRRLKAANSRESAGGES